jgi:transposase
MITTYLFNKIKILKSKSKSNAEISRALGINSKTVSKYLRLSTRPKYAERTGRTTNDPLLGFEARVQQWLAITPELSDFDLYKRLVPLGYGGSQRTINRRMIIIRKHNNIDRAKSKIQLPARGISSGEQTVLEGWRTSNNRSLWSKAVTILDGNILSVSEIAAKVECPAARIRKWMIKYDKQGLTGLEGTRKIRSPGKRGDRLERNRKLILEILHNRPKAFAINRASWSLRSLSIAFEMHYAQKLSDRTISRLIKRSGYSFKKTRRVLTSPDPDYREKVELLLKTLRALGKNEHLFFIDEMGPLRIKKYGGRSFVAKGDSSTYQQIQANKGAITMSAALNATQNRVTWLYSLAKDTQAMIDLIEILFNQYHSAKRLFITWDAASWHRSTDLLRWLDAFNTETGALGVGPSIHLVPLPRSAQFLDVLEAVFSGMKRAVIHHSDYRDKIEMKQAISRHFSDRNEHFRENPKRAGKKIWEIDFFDDPENIRGGTYREW